MNTENLKNIAEAIQALAVTAAILTGGVWSLFTFRALQSRRRAQLELDENESRIRGMAVVNLSLEVEPLKSPAPNNHLLRISATIHNCGSRNTVISFDGYPLLVEELVLNGPFPCVVWNYRCDHLTFHHPIDEQTGHLVPGTTDVATLRSGMSLTFEFLLGVSRLGVYRAVFTTRIISPDELKVAKEAGMRLPSHNGVGWSTERIFSVGCMPANSNLAPVNGSKLGLADGLAIYAADISKAAREFVAVDGGDHDAWHKLNATVDAMLNLRSALLYTPDVPVSELTPTIDALLYYTADPLVNTSGVLERLREELHSLKNTNAIFREESSPQLSVPHIKN